MAKAEKSNTADREIRMTRLLKAPISLVWEVWTNPDHIKNWWGPNGFTNTIQTMDVRKDGVWEFVMHGPDGTDFKNKNVFREIIKNKKIVYEHVPAPNFLATIEFEPQGEETLVKWHMLFNSREQFIQVVKNFKADEGLRQNIDKMSRYLEAQHNLRRELRNGTRSRASAYLNFPGNTEVAFNFYKMVFGGEFNGGGIKRFGDVLALKGAPPVPDEDKNLVLHVELPILGGFILMATDAPESMGFKVEKGNNMHINLEPATRRETKRLFNALSTEGTVTMELQDMFWGAYYGSCIDKFGINWMFHCRESK